jgi:menaquinone-dependent protoporphyrinogen oxidase
MARILVTYASKLGSTREIAEAIGEELLAAGHRVEVSSVNAVRDLDGVEAIVLGSALYAAHWQRDANRFVARNLEGLRAIPVWLFSSGPLDAWQASLNLPMTTHASEVMRDIVAREHRTFGGRLAADADIDPQVLATHVIGDFRDWDVIRAWARSIAAALAG